MIILDARDKRPLYEQIVDKLSELMVRGMLTQEEKLPSVRSLAMDLSINPNTIQRAYIELERRGYIYSIQGKGSFVAQISHIQKEEQKKIDRKLESLVSLAFDTGIKEDIFIEKCKYFYAKKGGDIL